MHVHQRHAWFSIQKSLMDMTTWLRVCHQEPRLTVRCYDMVLACDNWPSMLGYTYIPSRSPTCLHVRYCNVQLACDSKPTCLHAAGHAFMSLVMSSYPDKPSLHVQHCDASAFSKTSQDQPTEGGTTNETCRHVQAASRTCIHVHVHQQPSHASTHLPP